jgi:Fic family protein
MVLARAEGAARRFYSLSAQLQGERKRYADQPGATQRPTLDATPWLSWPDDVNWAWLLRAVQGTDGLLAGVLDKAQFRQRWAGTPINARQTLVLSHLLDGMEDMLTNAKRAAIGKRSADTALRDISDLLVRRALGKLEGGSGVRGVCRSNRDPDLEINWSLTPISHRAWQR